MPGLRAAGTNAAGLEEFIHEETGIRLVSIPGGQFRRRDEEGFVQEVVLSPFLIGKYEVRQDEWERVMGENPSEFVDSERPVENVDWYEAKAFCDRTGLELPSEAQWEYACLAGGEDPGESKRLERGWHGKNSGGETHPVGERPANAWGLHDTYGNVWEWCRDWWAPYSGARVVDPAGPTRVRDGRKVMKGGSFHAFRSNVSAGFRHRSPPRDSGAKNVGFRVARSLR